VQDRCTVCAEHTTGSEIILEAPDGTLDDVRHVEPHYGLFGDSVSVGAMHDLHQTYHRLRNHFERTR
jgi:hypothetical protein